MTGARAAGVSVVVSALAGLVPSLAAADPAAVDGLLGWTLNARAELSDGDGEAFSAGAAFEPQFGAFGGGITLLRATGATATAGTSGGAAPTIDSAAGWIAHRRGWFRYEIGFDRTDDEDLRRSDEWRGSLGLVAGAWDVTFDLSRRGTTFDPVRLVAPLTLRDGRTISVAGAANCEMDDTGYGLSLGWADDRWSAHVFGSVRDYAALDCAYASAVPPELQRLAPARFQALADAQSVRVGIITTGLLAPQAALLESSYGAGVARRMGPVTAALDVWRGQEAFSDAGTHSWTLTLAWSPTPAWAIELGGGIGTYESDDTPYATVGMRIRL